MKGERKENLLAKSIAAALVFQLGSVIGSPMRNYDSNDFNFQSLIGDYESNLSETNRELSSYRLLNLSE